MKQIETIKSGKNFSAVSVGKMSEIIEHVLPMGPNVTIQGKVFAGQAVGATGSELSFQTLVPGQDSGFLHTHKTHEELYIILKGEGQYQVDGEVFPVSEGTIIRVAPDGKRALKNTGSENLTIPRQRRHHYPRRSRWQACTEEYWQREPDDALHPVQGQCLHRSRQSYD